jgi:hypothetical protein
MNATKYDLGSSAEGRPLAAAGAGFGLHLDQKASPVELSLFVSGMLAEPFVRLAGWFLCHDHT